MATIGGLAAHAAELDRPRRRCRDRSGTRSARPSAGDRARRYLVDPGGPHRRGAPGRRPPLDTSRPAPARPDPTSPGGPPVPRLRQPPGDPRRRRRAPCPDLDRPRPARRAAARAGHRRLAPWRRRSRTTIRSTSGMAGYGSPATVRERLESADAILVLGCRLSEITSFGYSIPADGQAWMHVDVEPLVERRRAAARRSGRSPPTRGRSCGLPSPVSRRASSTPPSADARAGRERRRTVRRGRRRPSSTRRPGTGRASIPRTSSRPPAGSCPTTRSSRPTPATSGCGSPATSGSGGPGTFLGPTSGAMGYALPAAIAAGARPSRSDRRRLRRRRRLRDDDGRARDGGPREGQGRSRSSSTTSATARSGCTRTARGGEDGAIATDLGPIDFAAIARACGGRGIRVETDAAFEQALRQAMANDRPTVIQVALDRGWVHPDEPFAGAPSTPTEGL